MGSIFPGGGFFGQYALATSIQLSAGTPTVTLTAPAATLEVGGVTAEPTGAWTGLTGVAGRLNPSPHGLWRHGAS